MVRGNTRLETASFVGTVSHSCFATYLDALPFQAQKRAARQEALFSERGNTMGLPPLVPDTVQSQKRLRRETKRHRRWPLLLAVLVALGAATVWQVLVNRQPNVPVVGRPLSSSQTHLHTVVISRRPGVIYLGTHFGLFTSTDNGRTWPQRQGGSQYDHDYLHRGQSYES